MSLAMTKPYNEPTVGFTPSEREYVRRGLSMFFSTYPSVADGFHLKTWRSGPQAGRPKIPLTAKGLLERGLMRLDTSGRLPRLLFTDAGLAELRAMMSDRRLADPVKFAHVRREVGIDPPVSQPTREPDTVTARPHRSGSPEPPSNDAKLSGRLAMGIQRPDRSLC